MIAWCRALLKRVVTVVSGVYAVYSGARFDLTQGAEAGKDYDADASPHSIVMLPTTAGRHSAAPVPPHADEDLIAATLKYPSADPVPTLTERAGEEGTGSVPGQRQHDALKARHRPTRRLGKRSIADPDDAAARFLVWLHAENLASFGWPVDDLWYLASTDFAPAAALNLPPRNKFLAALKQQPGVEVVHDRRVEPRRNSRKTTYYSFPTAYDATAAKVKPPP